MKNARVEIENGKIIPIKLTTLSEISDDINFIGRIDIVEADLSVGAIEKIADLHYKEAVYKLCKPIKPTKSCVEMNITLTDEIPISQQPRRLAPHERETVQKAVQEWLENGIVRESCSEYASPVWW